MKFTINKQFQNYIKSLNLSFEDLLNASDIPNLLWKEELQVTEEQYYKLLHALDNCVDDQQILFLSNVENIKMFIPIVFAALAANNGLASVERLAKYKTLIGPIKLTINQSENTVSLKFDYLNDQYELPRAALLTEQLLLLSLMRQGTGRDIKPISVASPFDYSLVVNNQFKCKMIKNKANEITFNKSDLLIPFVTQNNIMWQYLEPSLNQKLQELSYEKSFSSIVRSQLYKKVHSGVFSIKEIAGSLGLSSRTMQRKLASENTNFKSELQKVQKEMTINYLSQSHLSIDEIAFLVGYSDASALARAFKKWTGHTITRYKTEVMSKDLKK